MPQISWLKDGHSLTEDEEHKILSGGRLLQITNAQVADTGRYTCLASNAAGEKSKSYSLNVLGKAAELALAEKRLISGEITWELCSTLVTAVLKLPGSD